MTPRLPWEVVSLGEEELELRVREDLRAADLLCVLTGSKAMARKVLARAQLTRASVPLGATDALVAGEELALRFHRAEQPRPRAGATARILWQDAVLLAAEKPARLLVHGDGSDADTLTDRVARALAAQGSPAVPQAVQRLDVDTTGVVLFSLTEELQPTLDALVAGHSLRKRYLAVVEGRLPASEQGWLELNGPLGRDRHDARRMRVSRTGKPSLTRVRTLDVCGGRALLLVELGSGRRHQIRVHLAHEGRPLVGDVLYGGARSADGLMLHAWEERFAHPLTGEELTLRTPWPARFARRFPEPESPELL